MLASINAAKVSLIKVLNTSVVSTVKSENHLKTAVEATSLQSVKLQTTEGCTRCISRTSVSLEARFLVITHAGW